MTIKILLNEKGNPPGKLADAELQWSEGPLAGTKLCGFAVWCQRTGAGKNVTFPSRTYSVNGERRSFALLRATSDVNASDTNRLRDLIIEAYEEHVGALQERAAS